jgi:putative peptide zinc metalloprotease protein
MHARALPRFRPDLKLLSWPRARNGQPCHFLRDPATGDTVELGEAAAFVCGLLDGRATADDVRREHERRFGDPLAEPDLEAVLQQLADAGALEGVAAGRRRRSLPELFAASAWMPWGRLRLGEGDRFAARLARLCRPAFTRPFHALAAAVVAWALWILATRWVELFAALSAHFSLPFALLLLGLSTAVVRSGRALVHAVQCKRYGGRVREIGVSLALYVVPAIYADWFDVARLQSRRERAWVVGAGVYYHLLVWAAATIGWATTDPWTPLNSAWLALSFGALVTFFLFTVNPLAGTDGYQLLVSGLEIPRLRERALAAFGSWVTLRPAPEVLVPRERRMFRAYGLLCFAYAVLVVGWAGWQVWSTVTDVFEGAGALALVAVAAIVAHKPLAEAVSTSKPPRRFVRPGRELRRWAIRLGIVALVVAIGFVPYPYDTGGPFMLLPVSQTEVHTQVEGQIVQVLVGEGDVVAEGQPLAIVDSREYERNLAATTEQLAAAQAKLDLALAGPKAENVITAERRLQKAEQEVELARVRHEASTNRAQRLERAYADRLVTAQEYETAVHLRDNDYQALQVALKGRSVAEAELALVRSGTRPEEIDALTAEVRSLDALLKDLRQQVELTQIRAPVAGRVITPYVNQKAGQYLKTGDLLATIEESRTIRAEVEVPEEDAAEVRQDAKVRAAPWAYPSDMFYGTVVAVAPAATENLQTAIAPAGGGRSLESTVVRVLTEFPNPDGRLKSNMTGYAKIEVGRKPLWKVLLWPLIRWVKVEVWYWIP